MGDRTADPEEQQRALDYCAAGVDGQRGGMEEAARYVQGGARTHEEAGMSPCTFPKVIEVIRAS